ncbi:MAG: hypothetical protein DAHOPDDO_02459 [Ignavibacteriaceae bacterium]|nr:hypothetical protein [Ignavibacteriaceae bacterium]
MKYKLFLLFVFFLSTNNFAQGIKEPQSLWEVYKPFTLQFVPSGVDTLEFLKGVIQDPNSVHYKYESAAEYLVLKNDANLRQFLINNMNNYPHKSSGWDSLRVLDISWDRYFTDQYIKGFLGIESAIEGMDSVARFHPNRLERIVAVRLLSRIGRLDYFDFIKSCYLTGLDENIDSFLSEYGKDSRYANEVKELLTNTIQDSTIRHKIRSATSLLSAIDKPYTISILDDKFRTTTGEERYYNYFVDLGRLDPEGQMERTIYAIENESADSIKALFLPSYFSSPSFNDDPKYYSPYFINFYTELINSGFYDYYALYSYNLFKPLPLDLQSPITSNITNLIDIIDSTINYSWLGDFTFSNELKNILTTAKTNLQNGDSLACRVQVKSFQDLVDNVYKDSLNSDPRFVTIEGWKFLYWNAQYILDRLPEPQANPNLLVNLKNSLGNQIPASNVMYYESATSGWKDAVNNGDGTFTVITTKPTVSIRMFYEYANQTVHNVPAQNNTYTFTTVNAVVELRNSSGNLMPAPSGDQGTVQYYADAWRTFGTTTNGVAYKELLPINYSFRMTYEYIPNDKQQDISVNSTVTFTTVLCTVKVTNANNQPLAGAATKYYSTAWRDIGLTNSEGIITKELLPKNLSFRATYGNVSLDKQQDISVNKLVEIQLNVP